MTKQLKLVLLTYADQDAGILPFDLALIEARKIAAEEGCRVCLRDPTTDRVLKIVDLKYPVLSPEHRARPKRD